VLQWRAVWDSPRPHVHPLHSPSGACLTADAPADHPWHHGLWFTIKFVDGDNFWEEVPPFGALRTRRVTGAPATGIEAVIDWVRPDGTVAVREQRRLTHRDLGTRFGTPAYAIDWAVRLVAEADVTYDRTPFTTWGGYGGLTLRGAPDWTDTRLLLPDGTPRDRVLGEPAPWCALDGRTDRGAAGILLGSHPTNPRSPVPWYASTRADTYGPGWANFLNAAFLWDAPLTVPARTPLVLRHRLVVHDGTWGPDVCAEAYRAWVE